MDIAGGTSFAAPAMAGIFALISQKYGPQGNADIGLYKLAASEYGTQTAPVSAAPCNSTLGSGVGSTCTFNDVTEGNISVPCFEADCYGSVYERGLYGVLSVDSTQLTPAYSTTPAWDFGTGLGSVNVANLFANWAKVATTASSPGEAPVSPVSGRPKPPVVPVAPIHPVAPISPVAPILAPVRPVAPVLAPAAPLARVLLER